jgi:uncharacterized damage-inducible protein DinB
MSVESLFLKFSADKLRQLLDRIEVCLDQLTELNDARIWARASENENAAGNLVLHLAGNVRQWITSSLGENPAPRDRDSEFSAREGPNAEQLKATLRNTVEEAIEVIQNLDSARLTRTYKIQNYSVSGLEAVYHVVEHFSQHAGQIMFITKTATGKDLNFYAHLRTSAPHEQAP